MCDKAASRPRVSDPAENRPVHEIRHRSIRAAIWKNQTVNGVMYTVTISRSYRNCETWHDSRSFRYDDLPIVAKLMFDAHTFISSLLKRRAGTGRKAPNGAPSAASR
jgi:hypothetical protein